MARYKPTFDDIEMFENFLIAKYSEPMVRHSRRAIIAYILWLADNGKRIGDEDAWRKETQEKFVNTSAFCNSYKKDREGNTLHNSVQRIAASVLKRLSLFLVRAQIEDIDPWFAWPTDEEMNERRDAQNNRSIRVDMAEILEKAQREKLAREQGVRQESEDFAIEVSYIDRGLEAGVISTAEIDEAEYEEALEEVEDDFSDALAGIAPPVYRRTP